MAKVTLNANVLTLTSTIKFADLKRCAAQAPDALKLKDSEGRTIFTVAPASINAVTPTGICFASATVAGGYACMSEEVEPGKSLEDLAEDVMVNYDAAMEKLELVEAQVEAAVAKLKGRHAEILAGFRAVVEPAPEAPAQGE